MRIPQRPISRAKLLTVIRTVERRLLSMAEQLDGQPAMLRRRLLSAAALLRRTREQA